MADLPNIPVQRGFSPGGSPTDNLGNKIGPLHGPPPSVSLSQAAIYRHQIQQNNQEYHLNEPGISNTIQGPPTKEISDFSNSPGMQDKIREKQQDNDRMQRAIDEVQKRESERIKKHVEREYNA